MNTPLDKNPYPGLRPFQEEDAVNFYGRGELTDKLFEKLLTSRFVAVMGESGCGKSSLVRAGLFSRLRKEGWNIGVMKPGADPMGGLTSAISHMRDGESGDGEGQKLWRQNVNPTLSLNSNGISELYAISQTRSNFLLCIDQFEELFSYAFPSREHGGSTEQLQKAIQFVNLITNCVRKNSGKIYILITMRSDFLGACARFRGLPELINNGQFLVSRLTRYQYQDAIVNPLEARGYKVAANMISQLLNDIEDDPDQLPIMQHALARTWELKVNTEHSGKTAESQHEIRLEDYEAAGGNRAIEEHADALMRLVHQNGLAKATMLLFRNLTEMIVTKNEEDGIRKPRTIGELVKLTGMPRDQIVSVIMLFSANGVNFLSPTIEREADAQDDVLIDLSHESLIRKWPALLGWIKDENSDRTTLMRLVDESKNFKNGNAGYLTGKALVNFQSWPKITEENFNEWAYRYAKQEDIAYSLDFRRRSTRHELITKMFTFAPLLIILGLVFFYVIIHQSLERNYRTMSAFTRNEFKSVTRSVKDLYGTYPAYVVTDNWKSSAKQMLTLPFIIETKQISDFIDSIGRNADDLKNVQDLYGVYFDDKAGAKYSPNLDYRYFHDSRSGKTELTFERLADAQRFKRPIDREPSQQFSFFGVRELTQGFISRDSRSFIYQVDTETPFSFYNLKTTYNVTGTDSAWQSKFVLESGQNLVDVVLMRPGNFNVFSIGHNGKKLALSRIAFLQGRPGIQTIVADDLLDYTSIQVKRFIAYKNTEGACMVYDLQEDRPKALPQQNCKRILSALSTSDNRFFVLYDSGYSFFGDKKTDKISQTLFKEPITVADVRLLKDNFVVIIGNKVKPDTTGVYGNLILVYDIERDELHSKTESVFVSQYRIPEVTNDFIVFSQSARNSRSFFWIFRHPNTTADQYLAAYDNVPAPYRYELSDYARMGIQNPARNRKGGAYEN